MLGTKTMKDCTLKILLVEDSEVDTRLFKGILQALTDRHGILLQVTCVDTMVQCLSLVHEHDLLVLDLVLPDSTGLESLEAILCQFPVPVVIWSGNLEPKIQFKAGQAGAIGYYVKGDKIFDASILTILGYACRNKMKRMSDEELRSQLLTRLRNGKNKDCYSKQNEENIIREENTPADLVCR